MAVCHVCYDLGKDGGCPKCGKTLRASNNIERIPVRTELIDLIPEVYHGISWCKPTEEDRPLQFKQFDDILEKVYNKFLSGIIPKYSMFIAAPPKNNKTLFAYSCMQTSLSQGFTVSPLMSTSDWRRIHKLSQVNPMYKMYGKYRWDTLISNDIVFLYVDSTDDRFDDIILLKSIYDTRAAFNLPTFVLSDYRLNDLVNKWKSEQYTMIYNTNEVRDYLRYPVIIHRFE